MKKFIITFGSSQLESFKVNPLKVALIVEGNTENEARQTVFDYDGIGSAFCTSYPYSKLEEFKEKFNMVEMTLEQLEETRKGNAYQEEKEENRK